MASNPTPGHILRENHNSKRYTYPNVQLQHYLQYLGHGSNLDVHQQSNG